MKKKLSLNAVLGLHNTIPTFMFGSKVVTSLGCSSMCPHVNKYNCDTLKDTKYVKWYEPFVFFS